MTAYSLRDAIRYIAAIARIELTDDELTRIVADAGDAIEARGQAVRDAAQKYESFVIQLAAAAVAKRSDPVARPDMSEQSQCS